jgi:uncharacterized protein YjbI with pentapeptide repeats
LTEADLSDDNLGGATHLRQANLYGATLHGTRLTGAWYDQSTRLPDGFNPEAAGMVLVEASA